MAWLATVATMAIACDSGPAGEATAAECSDGLDNDGDGTVDCGDIACGVHSFCGGAGSDAGTPPSSCGPGNCGGCCSGDTCLGGNSATACGAGGGVCVDCGPGRLCEGGGCAIDPASRWNVIVQSIEVNPTNAAGEAWDAFGGAPDPFVEVFAGNRDNYIGGTSAGSDVFAVSYDQRVATDVRADALQAYLAFAAWDEDTSDHDRIGACKYEPLGDGAFDEATVTLECARVPADGQAGFTLRWRLERN